MTSQLACQLLLLTQTMTAEVLAAALLSFAHQSSPSRVSAAHQHTVIVHQLRQPLISSFLCKD